MSKTQETASTAAPTVSAAEQPYLVVLLGEEIFVVSLPSVVKIINPIEIFPLPDTQEFILGIINFSGEIIPLVDLRLVLKLPAAAEDARRKFLICRHQEQKVAFTVDGVADTWDLAPATFSADTTRVSESDFIIGEGMVKGKVVGWIDMAAIITTHQAKP